MEEVGGCAGCGAKFTTMDALQEHDCQSDDLDPDFVEFVERTAMLLECLRNYRDRGRQEVDLEGALRLEPDVAALLAKVRTWEFQ